MANLTQPTLNVFLAEDNEADVYLVEMALQESLSGFKLHTVTDGEQALSAIARFSMADGCPAMAIIDQNLPRMDGDHVVRAIRAHHECARIPMVVMSSVEGERERRLVAECGVVFFRKPTNLSDFLQLGQLVSSLLAAPAAG
jgi:CheY-like chemotaxis protein